MKFGRQAPRGKCLFHYMTRGRFHTRSPLKAIQDMKTTMDIYVVDLTAKETKRVESSTKVIPYLVYNKHNSMTCRDLIPWRTQTIRCFSVWSIGSNAFVKKDLYSALKHDKKVSKWESLSPSLFVLGTWNAFRREAKDADVAERGPKHWWSYL